MTPPPAQMADVLAKFEAGPSGPVQGAALAASSAASVASGTDVVQASPAWPAATHGDFSAERVETGVAVIGADFVAETPKSPRRRWIAGVCGLLVVTGGAAFALSGGKGPSSREHTASSANETVAVRAAATALAPHPVEPSAAPLPVEPSGTPLPSPTAKAAPEATQEPPTAASPEPVAAAPPPPEVQEPEPAAPAAPPPAAAPEPAMPAGDVNPAREPAMAPIRHTAGTTSTPAAAPAPHPAPTPPKKNCGKFLKRCK
jgi:hypothetical protein